MKTFLGWALVCSHILVTSHASADHESPDNGQPTQEKAHRRVWVPISTGVGLGNAGLAATVDLSPHYFLSEAWALGVRGGLIGQLGLFGGGSGSRQVGPSVIWREHWGIGYAYSQVSLGYAGSTVSYKVDCPEDDFCIFGPTEDVTAHGAYGSFRVGYLASHQALIGGVAFEANGLYADQEETTRFHGAGLLSGIIGMQF